MKSFPPIPRSADQETRLFFQAIKEDFEQRHGYIGDPMLQQITVGQLVDAGIIKRPPVRAGKPLRIQDLEKA